LKEILKLLIKNFFRVSLKLGVIETVEQNYSTFKKGVEFRRLE